MGFVFSNGPVLTPGTAAAVGTVTCRMYDCVVADVDLSSTTETVSAAGSVDGKNFNAGKLRPVDLATTSFTVSSDVKDGLYRYDVRGLSAIKFTKSNTSETVTIRTGLM